MYINSLVLILTALFGGLAVFLLPKIRTNSFKLALIFSGAYLFAVTIIHILPELFSNTSDGSKVGIFVLLGFFMQYILENFTAGVEHGHLHQHDPDEHHHATAPFFLLTALCVHAFLEGSLLILPTGIHSQHGSGSLLMGISIHKIPAAFALMSVLLHQLKSKQAALIFLLIFALASPVGMWSGRFLNENALISSQAYTLVFALVCGNFLHISTTIFFESSPDHSFNSKKLVVSIFGATLAIFIELMS